MDKNIDQDESCECLFGNLDHITYIFLFCFEQINTYYIGMIHNRFVAAILKIYNDDEHGVIVLNAKHWMNGW